ncbi:MAG: hypothetical protein J7K40_14920 [candidate division Zixibacteria bacterium]|nr:hypothetical protein [candidate division Zixibacteria bacterium]
MVFGVFPKTYPGFCSHARRQAGAISMTNFWIPPPSRGNDVDSVGNDITIASA